MKRVLIFALAVMLVPMFLGVLCPCAMAAQPSGVSFTKVPCHGCCTEISAAPRQLADQVRTLFSAPFFSKSSDVLKALSLDASQDIAINRRAIVPAGDEPSFLFPQQPLYLALQVFRI